MIGFRIVVTQDRPAISQRPAEAQLRDQIREEIRQATEQAVEGVRAGHPEASITITRDGKVIRIPAIPSPPLPPELTTGVGLPPGHDGGIPPEAVDMAWGFFAMCAVMVVGWPIARAFGRRIERSAAVPAVPAAVEAQLVRIEQAVESMAVEVERISESQRFIARLQSQSTAERV